MSQLFIGNTGAGIIIDPSPGSAKLMPFGTISYGKVRQPTDPFFYANIELQNIITGTRYWIAQASDLSNVLASGTASGTTVNLSSIPAYANPMLIEVRLRSASGEPKYKPYKTYGYLVKSGVTVYCAQVLDTVAN